MRLWSLGVLNLIDISASSGTRGRGRRPPARSIDKSDEKSVDNLDGRAIPFEDLERFSKYKTWKELNIDSNGDLFIFFNDNRDMVIQQLDYLLGKSQNAYMPRVMYDEMLEYGCWCNLLDEKLTQGIGDPVDEIDEACRAWRRCLYCTRIDDTDCQPTTASYSLFWDYKEDQYNCDKDRGCAKNGCQCDGHLAKTLSELAPQYNEKYSKKGGFKKSQQCSWRASDWAPPDECCGNYPTRFPYNTNFGRNECCNNQVFQPGNGQCCVKNKLKQCSLYG